MFGQMQIKYNSNPDDEKFQYIKWMKSYRHKSYNVNCNFLWIKKWSGLKQGIEIKENIVV